ncbi:hypothetical protein BDN67DRAFT_1068119 [Paxillus ammoniavirescens]|nr:hypothetical protein BDN67DRAFT_1068119 [Paxillus ammoniavirescens]
MESPLLQSPVQSTHSGLPSRSRSSTKVVDDVTSLTSFNPFSEEDENDQSSYTLVTSLFSRMKSSFTAPLTSSSPSPSSIGHQGLSNNDQRRPTATALQNTNSSFSSRSTAEQRPTSLKLISAIPAPPLVSLTPVVFEAPSFGHDSDRSPSRGGQYTPLYEGPDAVFGTAIPGFPIQDDARSIRTTASLNRSASVSKVIRRIRGEGLSRDYWMDDENAKECYDCKSVFTTWRRKHHCRICGQIFCSRCASNIIKGSRFGHDGMVRVCNLCLEKLANVEDDDDDDRRSVVSSTTSPFPAHQLGTDAFTLNLGHHPQSPFAASQLFGRTDEPFNLYSIAETKRFTSGSEDSTFGSFQEWEPVRDSTAPFRRNLAEDEKDSTSLHQQQDQPYPTPATAPRAKTPIEFPSTVPVNVEQSTMSTIQFPLSSPEHGAGPDSPGTYGAMRSRFNSFGDFDVATPFFRSRVQSRLDSFPTIEGWRTRRDSTAYAQELNLISMFHLRIMLRQMLTTEHIPNVREWEETLLRLALRIARELTFTAIPYHQGEDMDVRRYVKIKKIPGGAPSDSEYVDGAVITKNVAHKQMLRSQRNPRVMLVTFPLEFHRVEGQYIHFGQVVRQEKEYLGNLVSRIAALRPHVVMVEKSVSRIALEALAQHNIAVARAVKPSATAFVARMTQGDVFSSIDKLALEPRLGHCARFRVQTFDHPLIPGQRKSYMRFEGCNRDMGCTIILRGGDFETLRSVKKVTRFLTFIVRNLKLETHLWKDSVITLPSLTLEAVPATLARQQPNGGASASGAFVPASVSLVHLATAGDKDKEKADVMAIGDGAEEDLPDADAERLRLSKRIQQSIEPYYKTFISVSATLRFPPPQPILRMKELDEELTRVQHAWEDDLVRREEKGHIDRLKEAPSGTPTPENEHAAVAPPTTTANDVEDVKAQIEALPLPDLPRTPSPEVDTHLQVDGPQSYFEPQPNSSAHILPGSFVVSPHPINVPGHLSVEPVPLKTATDIALESQLSLVKYRHEEQRRIWEWYLRKDADDFVVEKYQCIGLWTYTVPIDEFGLHRACFAPGLHYISFYGGNDCTLGQFIEKAVNDTLEQFLDPKALCAGKGCNQPLARHCQVFVHNETRLAVAVEQWDGQIKARNIYPSPDMITTWSACRVCGSATPFIPISEEMQRYSFGKFLELHFYPADVQLVQGAGCHHNIYQHHIRYFATRGMTVRFQADPVTLHEIVYPAMRIRIRPEVQLELKNADFERLHRRNTAWYTALVDDLKLISIDAATGEEEHDAKLTADINTLIARAEAERLEITHLINNVYKDSSPMDTLALNQVRSFRQDRIVAWQADFDKLPKPRNTQSGRRVSAFNSVRAMWPERYGLVSPFGGSHMPSTNVPEAEGRRRRRLTTDSLISSASEASEAELETCLETPAEKEMSLRSDEEVSIAPPLDLVFPATKSDPDTDSTIGASKEDGVLSDQAGRDQQVKQNGPEVDRPPPRVSRLPRRPTQHPSVAELVARYQDFIPATSVEELTRTAFSPVPPPVSESEQEDLTISSNLNIPRPHLSHTTIRGKRRHELTKKPSTSDFESGYAANAAPRFRRSLGKRQGQYATRIPRASSIESTSRRTSPDKRGSTTLGEPSSPPQNAKPLPGPAGGRTLRGKSSLRNLRRENPPPRPTSSTATKAPFRRPPQGAGTKVSNIARHFERINRETERANRRYAVIRGRKARPVASSLATVEVLESIKDAIKDESDSSDSSSEADDEGGDEDDGRKPTESSPEQSTTLPVVTVQENADIPAVPVPVHEETPVPPTSTPPLPPPIVDLEPSRSFPPSPFLRSEVPNPPTPPTISLDELPGRNSIFRQALQGLWPPQLPSRRVEFDYEDPLNDPEHIFRDSSMVVRTDEPTSIIALALNSLLYRDMLTKARAEKRTTREPKLTEGGEAFMPDDQSVAESSSTWGVVNVDTSDSVNPTDELKSPSTKMSWVISFESGGLTISCTILYPEQFDALRRTYDCEKSIIESLSRCVKWDANGGKSGSAFLKTRDDRFIAKELSRAELQMMETFAPAYFDYLASAVTGNRPTLLAKVFGCYKLTFKKAKEKGSSKAKVTHMNLLVMENLFYNRRFSKIYDLKGSTRNRHVQSTGRENEVLLDENLVETAHLSPFYLKEHSKRILRGALYNDSKFLADINVMDYSLVVGVDNETHELVVGIVDYIRTYTWDKKLESWVKESAFLGGGGKGEPTIVGPKQYRQRFISAMERYFPLVPDRWMKQKDASEEDPNSLADLWTDW